jgi:hypothetical protein
MHKTLFFGLLLSLSVLLSACGEKGSNANVVGKNKMEKAKGDSAIYGLASVGCSDSVLMLMPKTCENPQHIDILDAMRNHRVFGMPKVGDEVCVLLSKDGDWKADMVLNISELFGSWVYSVLPVPKEYKPADGEVVTKATLALRDSMLRTYMIPREYGFTLSRQNSVSMMGNHRRNNVTDIESPVEYPKQKRYSEWHVWNGKLVFTQVDMSVKNDSVITTNKILHSDTAEVVLLHKDSLQLRFGDQLQCYSRKKTTE